MTDGALITVPRGGRAPMLTGSGLGAPSTQPPKSTSVLAPK
jgi:hypothetical protein